MDKSTRDDPDVIHSDEYCTVYLPGSGKGVLVTTYTSKNVDVAAHGLLSNREANRQGFMDRRRPYLNDVVFFRPTDICKPTSSVNCYQIRVDPSSTYVFDQEYHAERGSTSGEPMMLLSAYLALLSKGPYDYINWLDFHTPVFGKYPIKDYNARSYDAHRFYEVRVKMDAIPLSFFETMNGVPLVGANGESAPQSAGAAATHVSFKGRRYKVRTGPRGGRFILVGKDKEKHYV